MAVFLSLLSSEKFYTCDLIINKKSVSKPKPKQPTTSQTNTTNATNPNTNESQDQHRLKIHHTKKTPHYNFSMPPCNPNRKVLVLDMDWTIIDSSVYPLVPSLPLPSDVKKEKIVYKSVFVFRCSNYTRYIKLRPGFFDFLIKIYPHYEVILYTQANREATQHVLTLLKDYSKLFSHVITRDEVLQVEKRLDFVIKHLESIEVIKEEDRKRWEQAIIVDDNAGNVWGPDSLLSNFIKAEPFTYFTQEKPLAVKEQWMKNNSNGGGVGDNKDEKIREIKKLRIEGRGEWGNKKDDKELERLSELLLVHCTKTQN
eukprot:TRINITY_DN21872_c0_g1_i1.p1 TRINITY_DN21872_c0_g1~~TRINITY_DN21872_c0_g1_i1.p1  ORF type:complete len:313 (-),score=58.93 TRINITY_DN21872_c0_g1_i1:51-989(-)